MNAQRETMNASAGFARLLGYRVMENFNWPYLQPNISAFWRSWHISLSRWCRDYVYSVVVAQTRSPALGAMATMIAIGLWASTKNKDTEDYITGRYG